MYKQGFTLVELLLVIAVAAVIFAFSAPYAINFYQSNVLKDAQAQLISALGEARHNAALQKNDSNFGVYITPGNYVIFQTPDLTYENRVTEQDEIFPLLDEISIATTTIIFSKLSGTTATTSTTTITYGNLSKSILIAESGNIVGVENGTAEAPVITDSCDAACVSDLRTGLVAYYPFDGDVNDYSDSGINDLTYNDATLTTGHVGSGAYSFDGNFMNLESPSNLPTGSDGRTVCTWINPFQAGGGKGWIVAYGNTDGAYEFGTADTDNNPYIGYWGPEHIVDSYACTTGSWCQICMTYNGTDNLLYFNSQLAETTQESLWTNNSYLTIGTQLNNWYNEYFHGLIDEVAIWNRVLDQADIDNLYNDSNGRTLVQ